MIVLTSISELGSSLGAAAVERPARSSSRGAKRSFFRSIKERMSRSKKRSRSVDPTRSWNVVTGGGGGGGGSDVDDDDSLGGGRSVSVDRARSVGAGGVGGVGGVGRLLTVPGLGSSLGADLNGSSACSSLSDVSAVSNASNRTYLDEASTLVLEHTENDVLK